MTLKILLVEDDKYFNKLVFDRLSLEGHQVQSVLDGQTAWEELEKARSAGQPFQLLISDMLLPRLMGAELFTRIREVDAYEKLNLIAISGIYKDPAQIKELSVLHGLKAYWTKPFDLNALIASLSSEKASTAESPSPVSASEGSIDRRRVELLLYDAYKRAFTGTLTFRAESAERTIYFANGFPVSVKSSSVQESLGNSLVELKVIDRNAQEKASQAMVIEGLQFGQTLLKMGILTKDQLFQGIRRHTYRLLMNSFLWREGNYEFKSLGELPDHVLKLEFNPILLMLKAHRMLYSREFLQNLYATKADFYLIREQASFQILPLFNLEADSLQFLSKLPSDEKLSSIVERLPISAHEILFRVLYILETLELIKWSLDPDIGEKPEVAHADFESHFHQEANMSASSAGALQQLQAEYVDILAKNYFQIFEIPEKSEMGLAELEEAYRSLRYRLHPDRFPPNSLVGQTQRILDDMLARIDKAYQTLSVETNRRIYLEGLKAQKEDSALDSKRFLEAQELFRQGQRDLQKQEYQNAAKNFRAAQKHWNKAFEYDVYASYAELKAASEKANEVEMQRLFNRIKAQAYENRASDVGFLILGHAAQVLGKKEQAKEAYQLALKNNEHNEEVALSLAKLGEIDFKEKRLTRAYQSSKKSLKRIALWLMILTAVSSIYMTRNLWLHNQEAGIAQLRIEEFGDILPLVAIRQKSDVAKITVQENKLQEIPTPVLTSKCLQLLAKGRGYGILEIYLFDEKRGLKGACQGEKFQLY